MKKASLIVVMMVMAAITQAQIDVSPAKYGDYKKVKFKEGDIAALKQTTTLFVYPEKFTEKMPAFLAALKQAWTFNDFEAVSYEEFVQGSYTGNEKYALLTISGHNEVKSSGAEETRLYLTLARQELNKRGKVLYKPYCRIDLIANFETYFAAHGSNSTVEYMYTNGVFYNLEPGFVKNYLINVNENLENGKERFLYGNSTDASAVRKLKDETLYLPKYMLTKYNGVTGGEMGTCTEAELVGKYPYKYEFLDASDLSDKILSADTPFYYMIFVRSYNDKFITIYNSSTGKIIYNRCKAMSTNMKPADFDELTKAIKNPPSK